MCVCGGGSMGGGFQDLKCDTVFGDFTANDRSVTIYSTLINRSPSWMPPYRIAIPRLIVLVVSTICPTYMRNKRIGTRVKRTEGPPEEAL